MERYGRKRNTLKLHEKLKFGTQVKGAWIGGLAEQYRHAASGSIAKQPGSGRKKNNERNSMPSTFDVDVFSCKQRKKYATLDLVVPKHILVHVC